LLNPKQAAGSNSGSLCSITGENMDFLEPLQVIWDYLGLHQEPKKADVIIGFGNFNTDIARRAAQLYQQGYAPKILFTGGLGRNTEGMLPEPEAVRFARVAMECGVPEKDILLEDKSRNTKENIDFTRALLEEMAARQGITSEGSVSPPAAASDR
jgi:uncharacterized SAM-binding protein YcdF (DUF218 family)